MNHTLIRDRGTTLSVVKYLSFDSFVGSKEVKRKRVISGQDVKKWKATEVSYSPGVNEGNRLVYVFDRYNR